MTIALLKSGSRFTNASLLPSGDGVGRTAPPGPPVMVSISPVVKSSRLMANISPVESLLYCHTQPDVVS